MSDDLHSGVEREVRNPDLVQNVLRSKIVHLEEFARDITRPQAGLAVLKSRPEQTTVEDLKAKILEWEQTNYTHNSDEPITVLGTFQPCVLLTTGWWERRRRSRDVTPPQWRDSVQQWLFEGFDLWAPSWDLSLATESESGAQTHLAGQIGHGDEADSIPILIHRKKAADVRAELQAGRTVLDVAATGVLRHVSQLQPTEAAALQAASARGDRVEGGGDYCLLVHDDVRAHDVYAKRNPPPLYSGYLWQCWGPRQTMKSPRLQDVYFIWEHTNFSDADCIKYNLDALEHKVQQLLPRIDDPVMLQKSHSLLIERAPVLSTTQFYELLFKREREADPMSRTLRQDRSA